MERCNICDVLGDFMKSNFALPNTFVKLRNRVHLSQNQLTLLVFGEFSHIRANAANSGSICNSATEHVVARLCHY